MKLMGESLVLRRAVGHADVRGRGFRRVVPAQAPSGTKLYCMHALRFLLLTKLGAVKGQTLNPGCECDLVSLPT